MQTLFKQELEVAQTPTSKTNTALSEAVFDDPESFLKVLKENFHKIPSSRENILTKNDLLVYAQNNYDDTAKAAQVVLKHWEDFREISRIPSLMPGPFFTKYGAPVLVEGISAKNAKEALYLYEDRTNYYVAKNLAKGVVATVGWSAATALSAGITAVGLKIPPVALMAGSSTLLSGGMAGGAIYGTYTYHGRIREVAEKNQRYLSSWPEINRKSKYS